MVHMQIGTDARSVQSLSRHTLEQLVTLSSEGILLADAQDPNLSMEEKFEVQEAFAKLPRNSCSTRVTRRCRITGRSHAVYRKFGVSRIMLRELTLKGELPGMRKSSW